MKFSEVNKTRERVAGASVAYELQFGYFKWGWGEM